MQLKNIECPGTCLLHVSAHTWKKRWTHFSEASVFDDTTCTFLSIGGLLDLVTQRWSELLLRTRRARKLHGLVTTLVTSTSNCFLHSYSSIWMLYSLWLHQWCINGSWCKLRNLNDTKFQKLHEQLVWSFRSLAKCENSTNYTRTNIDCISPKTRRLILMISVLHSVKYYILLLFLCTVGHSRVQ